MWFVPSWTRRFQRSSRLGSDEAEGRRINRRFRRWLTPSFNSIRDCVASLHRPRSNNAAQWIAVNARAVVLLWKLHRRNVREGKKGGNSVGSVRGVTPLLLWWWQFSVLKSFLCGKHGFRRWRWLLNVQTWTRLCECVGVYVC